MDEYVGEMIPYCEKRDPVAEYKLKQQKLKTINSKKNNNTTKSQEMNVCRFDKPRIDHLIDMMYYDKYIKPLDVREHEYVWSVS